MELLNIFYGSEENSDDNTSVLLQTGHMPWHPADLSTVSRILVWKGISHSLAQWHPCYLILSGLYLYVLESESSQNYQRCCSMAGRQVFEVSPTSVGGSLYTVAVSSRGYDVQKALESTSTLIIEFRDDEEKSAWLKALVQATYRASAPPKIDILGESVTSLSESGGAHPINIGSADLVINGTLVETKLLIYGKLDRVHENAEEELILELLGGGGKLNVVQSGGELTVKTKLHSLKIKDELQGRLSKFPQYLACSVLNDSTRAGGSSAINVTENESLNFAFEEDDCFKDAMQDFLSTPDHSLPSDLISNRVNCRDACEQHIAYSDALSKDKDQVKGKIGEIFYETRDENISDFVAVTFLTRNSESPLYEDIDTQLCIRMSALEFFCNRPTLVALIDFGLDVTLVSSRVSSKNDMDIPVPGPTCTGAKEESGQTLINGLLGYGKGRAVFNLTMDVDSVCVFLNKEDDSQLAKFVQESFLLDMKVHPSSISIDSTLGNMRLCDLSLGADNNWRWLCDTRNQGSESLIKFSFHSFSIDDDDYQGYDYSLAGRLSAVRIVFLYRFVQEITSYFMELASPHTEEAIKLVDKVGGIEWLIKKYEIEGAAAVKLDLSLDTPIIVIPKNSLSGDYMQLDLRQLRVQNNFSWHGCQESDPSAVHLDILHAELDGVNMAIGINGLLGKPMVQDCQGFNIRVRRSLRDVFHKVPTLAIEVQVGLLHGVMSAKEYNVILNCLYMNLYEPPKLPPSFRGNAADTKDSIRMLADKVNLSGQVLLSRTIVVVAVEINYALLQLRIGLEESPLAQIANGNLLKKCTYLSNESSFSISVDDGVEVSLLDSFNSEMNEECWEQNNECMDETAASVTISDVVSSTVPSFTFEAQVVSPELTFYDCSKLSLDDASHLEKLLRAKMDFSFMYSWKEKDTWARSLVKDLTIETGSGLVVLEPLDIQGGYSSVREKTNISLLSTDICIHLPLSVVSLILQLQNQASAALEFGNTNPLASCTNFKRLWVSSKGHFPGYNLTFWRPQAPPNYVILGDCVTSRPIPPSRVVVAVSNMYGRVRKPLGFKLIGSLSNFQELGDESQSKNDDDCSIWIPIAPPGYTTLGCVTHVGNQPPPCHIVYCLRSDLVASSAFSECLFYVPANSRSSTGFSIWRVDNDVGSFYAHTSVNCPPIVNCFDLHQILLPNHDWCDPGSDQSSSNNSVDNYQPGGNQISASSGWDILRSMSRSSYYMSTPHFERVWWEKGCDVRRPISIWRPLPRPGFAVLGDCITEGLEPPALGLVFKCDDSVISAKPVQFTKVAHILRKGLDEAFFWYPIPPPGYASLGCVVTRTDEAPTRDLFCCPRIDLVNQTNISEEPISRSSSSRGSNCWSIWRVENQAYTFLARSDFKKPSSRLAYSISDYVKPRTRENITAEMKLGFFSLTVMDNLFGTMTPLFDTTITNISLATHGRLEAMNAVLICSIAASTFNRRLEAWEPIIEPFDGIFKLETYDASEHPPSKIGKRVRIAATSTVNLNVSAANVEILTEAIVSWSRQVDMQKKISKFEEQDESLRHTDDLTYSALEEDDSQRVIVVNKLGCDIYLRKSEEISENIELLQHDNHTSFLLPSPRFSDRLNVVSKSRETRYYVAVQIFEAKGLPIVDDGNSHDYFCALRLLSDSNASDQRKLFPQSARTRAAKPRITKANGLSEGYAKWNELFIFEVPQNGLANLDVEVSNLSSRAGKGEVIGALCLPIGTTATTLKRAASIRILQQAADVQHFSSYRLKRKVELATNDDNKYAGSLVISTSCFERNIDSNFQRGVDKSTMSDRDDSFCVGLGPDGPWERISSLLPLSVVPKSLNKDPFAFEVIMRNGKKHVILRSLAVVVNETDVRLQVSICPASMLNNPLSNKGPKSPAVFTEEIFENQQYQPISGWGNKSSGSHHTEPGRWSTRDFLKSSKDFFEPPLPPAWRWTSAWKIEKSPLVDGDGWAYGTDFRSLNWPPTSTRSSSKSALDFVRRRRWVRTRQQLHEEYISSMRIILAVIDPDSSAVLPWTSMTKDTEFCLQIRPYDENSDEEYTWGQTVTLSGKNQSIIQQASHDTQNNVMLSNTQMQNRMLQLNRLEKIDVLLYSNLLNSTKQCFWLSVGTDASVLHTELNSPIYDWQISINSPLRLENKLPYQAEYAIWERTVDGNMAERQHGIISPAGCAFVNSADLRKPIYLTLFVQGGWVLEKDSILIMDLLGLSHVSSFWMVQQRSNRKLRVSVEHDMGGTDAAPKIVRLFVPYWISNDLSVPLSYRIVEVDPSENLEPESLSISRAVKSAKFAFKNSSKSLDRKLSSRKNTQIYEIIEDVNPKVMLSPQYYISRSGISSMPSRNDTISSQRVGISVAVRHSEYYSPGISLLELERKERIDVRAFASDGSYYKMSAQLKMASNRTKVIHFLPQILFINRVGCSLALSQYNTESEEWLHPDDPPKQLKWQSGASDEFLRLRLDGYKWSTPFSIQNEGVMCVCMKNDKQNGHKYLRVEVRSGTKISRHEVLFHLVSLSSPYRIENRSMFLPLWFRQVDSSDDSWQRLLPNAAASFFWEDIGRQRLLEVMFDGTGSSRSKKYNIDEVMDHQPVQTSSRPIRALRFTVLKEGKIHIGRISDWMPDNESSAVVAEKAAAPILKPYENDYGESSPSLDSEFHVSFELAELGVSIIDHMPEEILYMSVQNLLLSYSSGLGSGISRFKLRMHSIQVDNQLPFSPMPVLFRPQRVGDELEYILKFSMTMQTNNSLDFCVYPYLGLQGPDNSAFFINVHEPIVWRLHDMFQRVKLNTVFRTPATAISVDPTIKIGLLNISEIRFKFSMAMSPAQRPRGVLGFWSSLMTALGNTEHMPVRITQRFCEELCMRQSALISAAMSNIQKDLLSQPLQLLSGVDILGNASSALSNMSKGVAALSMDKKFIQSRQKQDSKGIEDIGDVIREGGGAFAKGLFRGVTGILTKPIEGAKSSGVEGFVQGVGKGIIGAAAQPVSGVLDLLSKTTEGANAVRMKIASAITSEEQMLRRRLPRAIGGDSLLRPYDEHKATGQAILQLAESGAFFSQGDLFKVRGKFALSDAYEDHFVLPKGKILIVTHRRTLLLQQPSNIMAQRKFNPARDPCSVLWDILWDDLVTMELTYGKKDNPGSSPSRLILYLQSRSTESKENARIIKCNHGSTQASEVYSSIELASKTYGPNASKDIQKRKVPRPITPCSNITSPVVYPKEVFGIWGIPEEQVPDPKNSVFGVVHSPQTRTGTFHEAQQKT